MHNVTLHSYLLGKMGKNILLDNKNQKYCKKWLRDSKVFNKM